MYSDIEIVETYSMCSAQLFGKFESVFKPVNCNDFLTTAYLSSHDCAQSYAPKAHDADYVFWFSFSAVDDCAAAGLNT